MSEAQSLHGRLVEGEELTIVCHDNPDPDCLASAIALGRIAAAAGIDERRILYSGSVSHPQNRAFVNLLDVDLQPFDADAVRNRSVRGSVLVSHVGRTSERDALPRAADNLATLEGVETAVVFGVIGDTIQLSARRRTRVHVGETLRQAFGDVGSAGGHREMAGGEVPLGIFADETTQETDLVDIVERVMTTRLVRAFNLPAVGDGGGGAERTPARTDRSTAGRGRTGQ